MGSVYQLTIRQLTGKWRLIVMAVLATLPVVIAMLMLRSDHAPSVMEFEMSVLSAMLAGSIAPLVVLAIAAPAFGNELEDRTLANLTLAPLARWQIAMPKLLASMSIAGPFIALSAFVTAYVAYLGDLRAVLAVTVAALAGVVLYASAFTWLGLVTTQAIGLGLLYVVLWEGLFAGFVQGVRLFSIRYHSIALMHAMDERRFAGAPHPSGTVAVITSVAVVALFAYLTVRRLRRMDVP